MEDVHLWMIDQHLGRRSVSDFQRGVLALRKREIIAQRRATAATAVQQATQHDAADDPTQASQAALASVPKVPDQALDTREALARAARLSPAQVKHIETIQEKAAPSWWPPSKMANSRSAPPLCWPSCPWPSNKPPPKTVPRA